MFDPRCSTSSRFDKLTVYTDASKRHRLLEVSGASSYWPQKPLVVPGHTCTLVFEVCAAMRMLPVFSRLFPAFSFRVLLQTFMTPLPPLCLCFALAQSATPAEVGRPVEAAFGIRVQAVGHSVPAIASHGLQHLEREVAHAISVSVATLLSTGGYKDKGSASDDGDREVAADKNNGSGLQPPVEKGQVGHGGGEPLTGSVTSIFFIKKVGCRPDPLVFGCSWGYLTYVGCTSLRLQAGPDSDTLAKLQSRLFRRGLRAVSLPTRAPVTVLGDAAVADSEIDDTRSHAAVVHFLSGVTGGEIMQLPSGGDVSLTPWAQVGKQFVDFLEARVLLGSPEVEMDAGAAVGVFATPGTGIRVSFSAPAPAAGFPRAPSPDKPVALPSDTPIGGPDGLWSASAGAVVVDGLL